MSCFSFPVFSDVKKSLSLEVGEEKIIQVPNLKGISNAGDIVQDVLLKDGESFILRGISWGDTQVTAWDTEGTRLIYSVHVELPAYVKELQSFLANIEGTSVNFLGKNIIVEGQLLRATDSARLTGILNAYPQVKNLVNQEIPKAEDLLMEATKTELYDRNLKSSPLGGGGLMLEGMSFSEKAKRHAESIVTFYFDGAYPALTVNPPEVTMLLDWVEFQNESDSESSKNSSKVSFTGRFGSAEQTPLGASPFARFVQALHQEDFTRFVPYTFFGTKTQDQTLEKILQAGTQVRVLSEQKMKDKSGHKMHWQEQGENSVFNVEIEPIVVDNTWIDCRVHVTLSRAGQKLFWKTQRLVLKHGQGVALFGLKELLQDSLNQESENSLKGFVSLSSTLEKKDAHLLLVLTPLWTIRS
jgi:hypothetical protein